MTKLLASLALSVALAGTAFAQMPSGVPSMGSAKAAADKASAKATTDTAAAKTSAQTTSKAAVDKGEADSAAAKTTGTAKAKEAGTAAKNALDLNTASEADLAALPGVGADNAKKIVAARPFARKDQLVSKKILTKDNYTKVKDLVIAKQPAKQPAKK